MLPQSLTALALAATLATGAAGPDGQTYSWEVVVDAPVAEAWAAFTTEAGIEAWMVPNAIVDFRVSGTIQNSYNADAVPGDGSWIVHHILAYEPERMYAGQFEVPAGAPLDPVIESSWTVTYFEPVGPEQTRIRVTMNGWQEGPGWDEALAFFEQGNAWTLEQLAKHFASSPESEAAIPDEFNAPADVLWTHLTGLVGGTWIGEVAGPEGAPILVRNELTWGPGQHSIIGNSWLGSAGALTPHQQTQIYREAESGAMRLSSVDERGTYVTGTIRLGDDPGTSRWTWVEHDGSPHGKTYLITIHFDSPDQYTDEIATFGEGGELKLLGEPIVFRRVEELPEEYTIEVE